MTRRVVITLIVLILYLVGTRSPLPFFDTAALDGYSMNRSPRVGFFGFFPLSVVPFVVGFLIVELFALMTPFGRRIRRSGVTGRRKLNGAALGLSAVLALVQSSGLAMLFAGLQLPMGEPLTNSPTWLLWITIATGCFVAAGGAEIVSRYGVGNGFALFFVAPKVVTLVQEILPTFRAGSGDYGDQRIMSLVLLGLILATVVLVVRRRASVALPPVAEGTPEDLHSQQPEVASTRGDDLEIQRQADRPRGLEFRLPPLPQGVVPVTAMYVLLGVLTEPGGATGEAWFPMGSALYPTTLAAGIVLFSGLAGWMFSARRRVDSALDGIVSVPEESFDRVWKARLLLATLVLVGGELGLFLAPKLFQDLVVPTLSLAILLPPVVLVLDLIDEVRALRGGRLERILTLDNLHLAEYLRARLDAAGIPCVVRGFWFRSLYFFFGPLFKMALMVPEGDRDRAERLVAEMPFRVA